MNRFRNWLVGVCLLSALVHPLESQTPRTTHTSLYSSLDEKVCKTIHFDTAESASEQICPGQSGFRLKVLDEDNRMSVTVVDPSGKEHPLRFDQIVTQHFSSVGSVAEWRMEQAGSKTRPIALTVRLNVNEDLTNPAKVTSYLVISRVAGADTCVVKVLRSDPSALEHARGVADHAQGLSCLHP